jgi:hypothetical protein
MAKDMFLSFKDGKLILIPISKDGVLQKEINDLVEFEKEIRKIKIKKALEK